MLALQDLHNRQVLSRCTAMSKVRSRTTTLPARYRLQTLRRTLLHYRLSGSPCLGWWIMKLWPASVPQKDKQLKSRIHKIQKKLDGTKQEENKPHRHGTDVRNSGKIKFKPSLWPQTLSLTSALGRLSCFSLFCVFAVLFVKDW